MPAAEFHLEVTMKRLFAIVAFLLASTAVQAQYTIDYNGQTIRIDPDRGTVSIPGVYDNTGQPTKRSRNNQDSNRPGKPAPAQAKSDPQTPAAAPANTPPPPSNTTANVAPTNNTAPTQPSPSAPAPQVQQDPIPAKSVQPPVVATAPVAAPPPGTTKPANSPLGIWLTEQKEGKIRIEQCGANLCGYSVDPKSNQNRTQILIDMKSDKDSKWSGRIFDPHSGSTYDSTIALKSPDSLQVQGCALGGLFCGGQTWSRVN
jgi:uncharacterized protein (DUF2147 family)